MDKKPQIKYNEQKRSKANITAVLRSIVAFYLAYLGWTVARNAGGPDTTMKSWMGWGRNTKLNCLEYHRDSEVNVGDRDFILLVAKEDDIVNGVLDTAKVRAFKAPAGVPVEVYATTLHYAPYQTERDGDFRVAVVLPRGTNGPKPAITPVNDEDKMLWACNKWLLAHPESSAAAQGAVAALRGENIDIAAGL